MSREIERIKGLEFQAAVAHLSSSVGHSLINAYGTIVSYAENLRDSTDPFEIAEQTDLMIEVAMAASQLMRRYVDFLRPHARFEKTVVDFSGLVTKVVEEIRSRYPEEPTSAIEWAIDLERLRPIEGDASMLRAMLEALLENAVEALPDSYGRISVYSEQESPEAMTLVIEDNGVGITPEVLEHIFEAFFTTKPRELHQGIGLALVSVIWRRHRGALAIKSDPNKGTSVRLTYLPVDSAPSASEEGTTR